MLEKSIMVCDMPWHSRLMKKPKAPKGLTRWQRELFFTGYHQDFELLYRCNYAQTPHEPCQFQSRRAEYLINAHK